MIQLTDYKGLGDYEGAAKEIKVMVEEKESWGELTEMHIKAKTYMDFKWERGKN